MAFLAALVVAVTAQGQAPSGDYADGPLPSGPRGERIKALVAAVNSGDQARIEAFYREALAPAFQQAVPMQQHLDIALQLGDAQGGLDIHGVRTYTPPRSADEVVAILKGRLTGAWRGITFRFEPDPPHRISGLNIAPARPPKNLPPLPALALDGAVSELQAHADRLVAADAFSGTALLAKDGRVVWSTARGLADRNHGVPNKLETKFNLGSMNKMFTAVAVAQLVEEDKLRFEDSAFRYLGGKGWTKADLSKVKIEHLLSHTSGLGSYFNDAYERSARQLFRRVDDYKPLLAEETLVFEPGTDWAYSNSGFLLLGAVIEAATGRDYFDVIRERIYAKAGMKASDCYDIDLVVPDLAIGYSRERTSQGRRWRSNTFAHVIRGGPAGGGYSTVTDLLAFGEALRGGKLVGAASLDRLFTARPPSNGYGFGFQTVSGPCGKVVGHGGGFDGINSNLDLFLDRGYTAVVMSNQDMGAMPLMEKMRELVGRIRD